ncbi:MAG: GIY-YIG nuclease family protein [Phycisphaerales bacterium]
MSRGPFDSPALRFAQDRHILPGVLAWFHAYLLRCADGTFYAGSWENLADRVATHNNGQGAAWTATRRPVELVHSESFSTRADAIAREHQLKRWTHAKKAALANGDTARLRALAKRRT